MSIIPKFTGYPEKNKNGAALEPLTSEKKKTPAEGSKELQPVKPKQESKALPPQVVEETKISEDFQIFGNVISNKKVVLDGTIHGDVQCKQLSISKNGNILGNVVATEIEVEGSILGPIFAQKVKLKETASVEGDIHHRGLSIEFGANFDGRSIGSDDPYREAPIKTPSNEINKPIHK